MLNKHRNLLILIFIVTTRVWSQNIEIEKVMDVAPGVTVTLSPILIKNDADDQMVIEEIKIEIQDTRHIRWDPNAGAQSIYTELYNKKLETREIFGWNYGKYMKFTGIPQTFDLLGWLKYDFETKQHSVSGYAVLDEGYTIKLKYNKEKFDEWVLDPHQGIKITNLPVIVDHQVESEKAVFKVTLRLDRESKPLSMDARVDLNPFIPQTEIVGDYEDHVSFLDKTRLKGLGTKENILPGPLQISCPNSKSMFEEKDRIYVEIKNTQGGVQWTNRKPYLYDDGGNEIEYQLGAGYEDTERGDSESFTVLSFKLLDNVHTSKIRINGLSMMSKARSRPIIGTYDLVTTILSGNKHVIASNQKIMFGNPKFKGGGEVLYLYPDQTSVVLPSVSIVEAKQGALITVENGIRLKIVNKIDDATQSVKLTKPTLSWAQDMLTVEYRGTASERMVQVAPTGESDEIYLEVSKDFRPGDDLEIIGLQVHTMQNAEQEVFNIVASYDGGKNFYDAQGDVCRFPRPIHILSPQIVYNSGSSSRYLFKDKAQPMGTIAIINTGEDLLFQTKDILLIKLDRNIGTIWDKKLSPQPQVLEGHDFVESIRFLTIKDEILLVIKGPIPAKKQIVIGRIGLQDFKKKGKSNLSLAFLDRRAQPIATSESGVEVTTPLINSMYSQILTRSEPIQKLSGIKITRHEGLGFEEDGVLLRLPENMPVTWQLGRDYEAKIYSNGTIVHTSTILRSGDKDIHIQPLGPIGETVYIHNLNLKIHPTQTTHVDTGRMSFSFNQGRTYSNRDEHMLRFIEPQDRYSIDIKKYKTISSNMAVNDEPVKIFIETLSGEIPAQSNIAFNVTQYCSLRTSGDYYHPKRVPETSANGLAFSLAGESSVESPGSALIINNLHISGSGLRERLKKMRLGFAVHNYAGVDTILVPVSLFDLAQRVTIVKPKRSNRDILPEIKITAGNWERAGPNDEELVMTEIKILNPIMSATENNRIQVLSESNINNIRTYVDLRQFDEAEKKIDRIIRHSNKYWIGYWLQHQLYASQNQIEAARAAIAEAERFGWITSNMDYPKHLELIASPIERAQFHYRSTRELYYQNRLWEADSMISMLNSNYVVSAILDTVDGGNRLITEILNLGAEVSTDFRDYTTAAEYYYAATSYGDDPEHYEILAEAAYLVADSLNQPFMGEILTEMLPPSEIDFVLKNPFATQSSFMLTASGMKYYPVEIAKQPHRMNEVIAIQGGVNYRVEPRPNKEEFKRLGAALLLTSGVLGITYYNQGF